MAESLETRIADLQAAPGTVACVWLGQAGYVLKTPSGTIVMIDPYLSDYAEQQWMMPRAIPPAIDPARLKPDILLVTHWHEDHLDAPTVKRWATDGPGIFVGPELCALRARAWRWPEERVVRLDRGQTTRIEDVEITATHARHDTPSVPAPDAVGFLLDIGGVRIWNVGDTEYDAHLRPMREERIDVALIPINGVGGNLTAKEAAFLLWQVGPKLAILNHYNMWAPEVFGPGATLDPTEFTAFHRQLGAAGETRILEVGEIVVFGGKGSQG